MKGSSKIATAILIGLGIGTGLFFLDDDSHSMWWLSLIITTPLLFLTSLGFLFVKNKFRDKFRYSIIAVSIASITWFSLFAFIIGFDDFFAESLSTSEQVSQGLEGFYEQNGHYPENQSSENLLSILEGINGNEVYPEYFSYHLDSSGEFYLLKLYRSDTVHAIFDSRTNEERQLPE